MMIFRQFCIWFMSKFRKDRHIPMEEKFDQVQLPRGKTPIWLDVPEGEYVTQREILRKISQYPDVDGLSVTVLYRYEDRRAEAFCEETNWTYRHMLDFVGCEDSCVVLMDSLSPETISRPHKLLVVVTTQRSRYKCCQQVLI